MGWSGGNGEVCRNTTDEGQPWRAGQSMHILHAPRGTSMSANWSIRLQDPPQGKASNKGRGASPSIDGERALMGGRLESPESDGL